MLKLTIAATAILCAPFTNGEAAPDNLQMSFNKDMHNFWRGRKRSQDTVTLKNHPMKISKNSEKSILDVGHLFEGAVRDEVDVLFGQNYHEKGSSKENEGTTFSRRAFLHRKPEKMPHNRKGEKSMKKLDNASVETPKEEEHHLTFLDVMETYADNVNRYGF